MGGRSLRIFLVDGTASGTRTAELGLSTIKALAVPRASLSSVVDRPEIQKTGVYVLVGEDPTTPAQKCVYIGEGDTILKRLTVHNKDAAKDFWEEVVLLVSKDENLTKAHVRYIEARLISLAIAAKRAVVTNGTAPSEYGKLPESDQVDMEEFITQARLLLGVLGFDLFEPVKTPSSLPAPQPATPGSATQSSPPLFKFAGDNFDATCEVDIGAGHFVVKAGSKARKFETPSLQPTYKSLRQALIANKVLRDFDADRYEFSQDYAFTAATAAAQVVCGSTANGRAAWRTVDKNISFSEWQDALLPAVTSDDTSGADT